MRTTFVTPCTKGKVLTQEEVLDRMIQDAKPFSKSYDNQVIQGIATFIEYANSTKIEYSKLSAILINAAVKYNYHVCGYENFVQVKYNNSNKEVSFNVSQNPDNTYNYKIVSATIDVKEMPNAVYNTPMITSVTSNISDMEKNRIISSELAFPFRHRNAIRVTPYEALNEIRDFIKYADLNNISAEKVIDAIKRYIGDNSLMSVTSDPAFIDIKIGNVGAPLRLVVKYFIIVDPNGCDITHYSIEVDTVSTALNNTPVNPSMVNVGLPFNNINNTPNHSGSMMLHNPSIFDPNDALREILSTLKSIDQNITKLVNNSQSGKRVTIQPPSFIGSNLDLSPFSVAPNRNTVLMPGTKLLHITAFFDAVLTIIKKVPYKTLIDEKSTEYNNLVNSINSYAEASIDYLTVFLSQEDYNRLINDLVKSIKDYRIEEILGAKDKEELADLMRTILYINPTFSTHFILALSKINTPNYKYSYKSTMNCDGRCIIRSKQDNTIIAEIQYEYDDELDGLFPDEEDEIEEEEEYDIPTAVSELLTDIYQLFVAPKIEYSKLNVFTNRFVILGHHIDNINKNDHSMVFISILHKCKKLDALKEFMNKIKLLDFNTITHLLDKVFTIDPYATAFLIQLFIGLKDDTYKFEHDINKPNILCITNIKTNQTNEITISIPRSIKNNDTQKTNSISNEKVNEVTDMRNTHNKETDNFSMEIFIEKAEHYYHIPERVLKNFLPEDKHILIEHYKGIPVDLSYEWLYNRYRHISGSDSNLDRTEFFNEFKDDLARIGLTTVVQRMLNLTTSELGDGERVPKKIDIQG